jgi:GntR family carbon starvation induced transcriptional regulator
MTITNSGAARLIADSETVSEGRTLTTDIYERLRSEILECKLKPGARLRFDDLREAYDIGLSPLREALMRLAAIGLVTLEEHKGFRVAPVSKEELMDIYTSRREIEPVAIRHAIEKGDDRWEAEVVARFHALSKRDMGMGNIGAFDPEWERRHTAFHLSLYSACGSRWMAFFCRLLFEQSERYRRLWFQLGQKQQESRAILDEHRGLMEAVIARDADAAGYLIQKHISVTANGLLESQLLFQNTGAVETVNFRKKAKTVPRVVRKKKV